MSARKQRSEIGVGVVGLGLMGRTHIRAYNDAQKVVSAAVSSRCAIETRRGSRVMRASAAICPMKRARRRPRLPRCGA